jgi:hypothetical protein
MTFLRGTATPADEDTARDVTRSCSIRCSSEIGHGGDVQGFASALYAIPEKKFAVVVLSNGENEKASIEYIALARKIYDIVTAH